MNVTASSGTIHAPAPWPGLPWSSYLFFGLSAPAPLARTRIVYGVDLGKMVPIQGTSTKSNSPISATQMQRGTMSDGSR